MSIRDFKITPEQIAEKGVIASPDTLTGTPDENKSVFDRLASEIIVPSVNGAIEMLGEVEDDTVEWASDEAQRKANESERQAAEQGRIQSENGRASAEAARVQAENSRVSAEQGRATAETARVQTEQGRAAAEANRVSAEQGRASAESGRQTAEQQRAAAEDAREDAEDARELAEQQRADETAGIVAQATEKANAAADSAIFAESWAQGGTGTRSGEDTDNAEYYAVQAGTAATTATQKAGEASGSASDALASKNAAAASALEASQDAQSALGSKNAAESAASRAEQAAADAEAIAGGDYITNSQKGVAGGVASLDASGKLDGTQKPAYTAGEVGADPTGSAAAVQANLVAHTGSTNNPHNVTAEQAGAIPLSQKGQPGGVATLDSSGKVPSGQLPAMDYVPDSEKGAANGVATLDGNGKLTASQKPAYTAGEVGAATTAYVDTKVSSEAGARSSADTNLQNQINTLSNTRAEFYYGTYTGDGKSLRFISLGFAPKAVICAQYDGQILDGNRTLGGIVFPGATATQKEDMGIYIEGNGFYVQYTSDEFWNNSSGRTYYYIAVK